MKKTLLLLILTLLAATIAACGSQPAPPADAALAEPAPAAGAEAEPSAATQVEEALPEEDAIPEDSSSDVLVIKEKMFIAQCNDIYLNPDDYMDKTIKLEGAYSSYTDTTSGTTYHYVNRKGPGCCGDDGVVGFEFLYDGTAPADNAWIEVTGKIEKIEENGMKYLALRLSELNVLEKRGADYVAN